MSFVTPSNNFGNLRHHVQNSLWMLACHWLRLEAWPSSWPMREEQLQPPLLCQYCRLKQFWKDQQGNRNFSFGQFNEHGNWREILCKFLGNMQATVYIENSWDSVLKFDGDDIDEASFSIYQIIFVSKWAKLKFDKVPPRQTHSITFQSAVHLASMQYSVSWR